MPTTSPSPVAVVTGASRGLGAGLAQGLAGAGVRLGVCARTEPAPPHDGAVTASVDVADAEAVEGFAADVADRLGPIELWVNNAGVLAPIAPLRATDPAEWERHLLVNVVGVANGARAFLRHRRPGGGVLVNISSGAATTPYRGWSAYSSGKAAIDMLTQVVAAEEAGTGLRTYALSPGVIDTDMQALIRATDPDDFPDVDRFRQLKERDEFTTPEAVADEIHRLAFVEHDQGDVRRRVGR